MLMCIKDGKLTQVAMPENLGLEEMEMVGAKVIHFKNTKTGVVSSEQFVSSKFATIAKDCIIVGYTK
jgi:hypothetical protein